MPLAYATAPSCPLSALLPASTPFCPLSASPTPCMNLAAQVGIPAAGAHTQLLVATLNGLLPFVTALKGLYTTIILVVQDLAMIGM